MPLSILDGLKFPDDTRENPVYEWTEGQEVTTKYEPYIPPNLAGKLKEHFQDFYKNQTKQECKF